MLTYYVLGIVFGIGDAFVFKPGSGKEGLLRVLGGRMYWNGCVGLQHTGWRSAARGGD